jgi:hypothetical protein
MLTGGVWIGDFLHSTPFMDLLPPNSMFFAHPLKFMWRYIEVYQMHSEHVTAKTAEMRRQKVEDVKRRSEYRKAHGLEDADDSKFGGEKAGICLRSSNRRLPWIWRKQRPSHLSQTPRQRRHTSTLKETRSQWRRSGLASGDHKHELTLFLRE